MRRSKKQNSWISDRNDFSCFLSTSHRDASYQVSICHLVQEKKPKIDFKNGRHGCHLGFPIGIILPILNLQVSLMLPTKFQVNWPLGSGEEAKNRISRWPPRQPPWISDWNHFSYFLSTSHHDVSYQVSNQLAFWFKRRSQK